MPKNEQNGPEEISLNANKINILAPKTGSKGITPEQGVLNLEIEKDVDFGGIGMGVLSDGTPYLNQRGLAVLCGVQNAHMVAEYIRQLGARLQRLPAKYYVRFMFLFVKIHRTDSNV